MSNTHPPIPKFGDLSEEQLKKISGGECTAQEWIEVLGELQHAYETLVDFTSYVIERVVTSSTT